MAHSIPFNLAGIIHCSSAEAPHDVTVNYWIRLLSRQLPLQRQHAF
jgi:hypothetical protein